MWILTHAVFAEMLQPMNAVLTFLIGLNDCIRAIRGQFTFAAESFKFIKDKVYFVFGERTFLFLAHLSRRLE